MSTSVIVYNNEACRRYLLPASKNTDYELVIFEKTFWLEDDYRIPMVCSLGKWYLEPEGSCRFFGEDSEVPFSVGIRHELKNGERLRIVTVDGETMNALVRREDDFEKLVPRIPLEKLHRVRFGTSPKSELRINAGEGMEEARNVLLTREWHGFCAIPRDGIFYLNGSLLRTETSLQFGDIIETPEYAAMYLGTELAVIRGAEHMSINAPTRFPMPDLPLMEAPEDAARGKGQNQSYFHRAPRLMPRIYSDTIKIESVPELGEDTGRPLGEVILQSLLMVIPMLLASFMMIYASSRSSYGGSIMMYTGLVMAIASGSMGAILAVMNNRSQEKRRQEKANRRFEAYSNYLINKTDEIRKKYQHNTNSLRETYPATEDLLAEGSGDPNLWNRNVQQEDFLQIRVGMGDIPFQAKIDVPEVHFSIYEDELRDKPAYIRSNFETLYDVPVLLDLREHPLIGLVGGTGKVGAQALAKVICAQIAATHSYTDVRMVFLCQGDSSADLDEWEFAKWLPHSFSPDRKLRMTAINKAQISDVSYELASIFRRREEESSSSIGIPDGQPSGDTAPSVSRKKGQQNFPHYVIFLTDPALVQGELISSYIFERAGDVGLTTFILSDTFDNLPNECKYVLQNDERFCGIVEAQETSREHLEVVFDEVRAESMDRFALGISKLKVEETGGTGEIPDSVTFFELYGIHRLDELTAEDRWRRNRIYDNVRGLLGLRTGGEPLYMDVHEKMYGPHGLVAGTTGSGKSETLQTYLLSLAVEYSPDDIGFFIIDYKGGGMGNMFDGLPHLLGSISNLSGAQIRRAMVAIKSENRRRQKMLNTAGVNNINKYTVMYKSGEVTEPLPHLFIVIDEFAELKREEPDFMKELISVAQVGRSLGVHLILSTQRPAGTVDDNIASNARFRLCLRVQTKEDSHDMIGRPDAAYITQAGRCYLEVGNNEVYELFQSGYSGAVYDPDEVDQENLTRILTLTCRDDIVALTGKNRLRKNGAERILEKTQFDAVKEYLARIAEKESYQEIHRLWLPLLPQAIALDEVPTYTDTAFADGRWAPLPDLWELSAVIGLVDDPANQDQVPLTINFASGHHAVIGQVVSGKSTMLQTIVFSLACRYAPDYLNIYGMDFSSRMLSAFEGLPHVGGIMYENENEKIERFFHMIEKTLDERKKIFQGGNYSQYYRANGLKYPAILIVIDNFSAFNEKTDEKHLQELIRISKEGENNGIFLLISGAGFSMSEIPSRLGSNFKTCLCLQLKDRYSYTDYLHTTKFEIVPESGVYGRGLCVMDGKVLEFQTALALRAEDDYARNQEITERVAELSAAWDGVPAAAVPTIPDNPDWAGFSSDPDTRKAFLSTDLVPVAYREDNAQIYSVDLRSMMVFLVSGPARSGKSVFLNIMIMSILEKPGAEVFLVGRDPVAGIKEDALFSRYEEMDSFFRLCSTRLTEEFAARSATRRELETEGMMRDEVFDRMSEQYHPIFIVIQDLSDFTELIGSDPHGITGFMDNLVSKGDGHLVYVIVSLSLDDRAHYSGYPIAQSLTSRGYGIHLGGYLSQDPYLKFGYLSFAEQGKPGKIGVGQISDSPVENDAHRVIIPSLAGSGRKVRET